ncbi:hypothetical protein HUJ04_008697 [Dendroctonus ponderosae]|nr:hypothetical protein HUJ04_008697 [Dendroctonus ponderosae]KAH1008640.1 hypothetical protein HUJ05_009178 [Dendroctonus ponderosae]
MAETLSGILNGIMKVDAMEEAFSCFLVHRSETERENIAKWQQELCDFFEGLNPEHLDFVLRQYLNVTSQSSRRRMQVLIELLEHCIRKGALQARKASEFIITTDQLHWSNAALWMNCFQLISDIIELVDYKGVRELMKGCCEKAKTLPLKLTSGVQPQCQILLKLVSKILDRDVCLLPGYLLTNELQKIYSECPHWTVASMFTDYVESFRPCAQMVSIIGHSQMRPVIEQSGCPDYVANPWKLDPITLRFALKGTLPYDPELTDKQVGLLRYAIQTPYSRDMYLHQISSMMNFNKQIVKPCQAIEDQLVELIIDALDRTEIDGDGTEGLWQHITSQLIYFVLFNFATFHNVVTTLVSRVQGKEVRRGRDQLMWVLLQFLSGSIQRNPVTNFFSVLKLYEALFPEHELPSPVPDFNQPQCTRQMAMACIWIHISRKASHTSSRQSPNVQSEGADISLPLPNKLKAHLEFIQHLTTPSSNSFVTGTDYRVALLCNAYSTYQEFFNKPMMSLVESIQGGPKAGTPNCPLPTCPLSMTVLDSLTVHSKMSLIHSTVTQVIKLASSKSGIPLAPALVETYSRLLVYTEIESLGIKAFIAQLLPQVYKYHAWGILYTLLEMFSYRLHHIHPRYRVQLLTNLHSLAAVPQSNQTQLHLCVESTALRVITGKFSLSAPLSDFAKSRCLQDPKSIVSQESEELNRLLVLTLARAIHVTGSDGAWCHDLLVTIAQSTPHSWAPHSIECFPRPLQKFFAQHSVPQDNKQQLKKAVEEENRKWASMNNENDIMAHFGVPGAPPLFLCLVWKMLMETNHISPIVYKILERIGSRALSAHLRKLCDCLVYEFASSAGGQVVTKCIETINDMMFKYNIITIDRLVLCLALRTMEGNEAQVCLFVIQLIVLKSGEFRSRVTDFVRDNSPDYWNHTNWYEKHMEFLRKYPEKFAPEEQSSVINPYFSNVCLRFLPVLDIVVHRYLELYPVQKSLENLLDHVGCLFKFHDRPVTYMYNTFHCYETKLRDRPNLKRRLVSSLLSSLLTSFTEPYQQYLKTNSDDLWVPELDYYMQLTRRVVDRLNNPNSIYTTDWRFNEFPNAGAHILYITCVELMGLAAGPTSVGNGLLDVIKNPPALFFAGYVIIPSKDIHSWINAIGLIMSALPISYWSVIHDRLLATLGELDSWRYDISPFRIFNFKETHLGLLENRFSYMLGLAHSIWHHAGPGQIATVPAWVAECLPSVVRTEEQFLFVCHLVGPFLQRITAVMQLTTSLYELLAQVDANQSELKHIDPICDFLYHIKYMFVGDSLRKEIEVIVRKLRSPLQYRLRFMAPLNLEEAAPT